jgi:hypothetical protein
LQAHCQSPTSQRFNQSFCQRTCKASPGEEFQNFSPTLKRKKIKHSNTLGDTDRKENETNDKFYMKVQFDRNLRTDKNRHCITGGIFYCRHSGYFSVSASNKLSCNLTGQCFEIGNKNIPPNRQVQTYRTTQRTINQH